MPWTGQQFSRHNHALHGERADHAARMANAILRSGAPEGVAIATASKWARQHRQEGGMVDQTAGGMGQGSEVMNPQAKALMQRYSTLSPEKLQEMSIAMGSTPRGDVVRRVLSRKRMMGTGDDQQVQSFADGGPSMAESNPWWERQEAYAASRPATGFLSGATPGRADSIKTTALSGSYVWPADFVAALGEGNSLAGARVLQFMLSSGPYGTPMPRGGGRRGPPPAPAPYREPQAKGGGVKDGGDQTTPVALSHGEFVSTPEEMAAFGGGDVKRGHRIADELVLEVRRRELVKMKKRPPPVGAKRKK